MPQVKHEVSSAVFLDVKKVDYFLRKDGILSSILFTVRYIKSKVFKSEKGGDCPGNTTSGI